MTSRGGSGGACTALEWGRARSSDVQRFPTPPQGGASTPSPYLSTPAPTIRTSRPQKPTHARTFVVALSAANQGAYFVSVCFEHDQGSKGGGEKERKNEH